MGMFDSNVDFGVIDQKVAESLQNTRTFEEVPEGVYIAKVERMEIGETKTGNNMFKIMMRLHEGCGELENSYVSKYTGKKPCVFMNKVIEGTKNDRGAIASTIVFLNSMEPDTPVVFDHTYENFKKAVLDCMEEVEGLSFEIEYSKNNNFSNIKIREVFED